MKLGAYELNRTYCGNNTELIAGLPDACIDLTVTSPPYDNLRSYNGYTFDFETLARELYRVTKPGGVVVWVVADATVNGSESGTSFRQALYFMECGFNLHDTMIYQKNALAYPTFDKYYPCFEYMFVLSKGTPKSISLMADKINSQAMKSITGNERQANGTLTKMSGHKKGALIKSHGVRWNVWKYNTGTGHSATDKYAHDHPAIFPEALARDHITSWSNPGDVILDPFMGSGTVAKMSIETGRNFIGFEISEKYVALCNRRAAGAKVPLFDWTSA